MESPKSPVKEKKIPQKRGRKPKSWHLLNPNTEPGVHRGRNRKDSEKSNKGSPGPKSSGQLPAVPAQLTTKNILDLVYLDHNYCQIIYPTNRSKVQQFRHLFGPKDEFKANFYPETLISPNKFLPPVPPPPPPPPVTSKLEYLLKRGNSRSSLSPAPSSSKRSGTPTKRYWDVHEETDTEVDVTSPMPQTFIPYDAAKAHNLMTQCEKHALVIKPLDAGDNWESHIVRTGWTDEQEHLFDNVIKALDAERLARLAYIKHPAEPVLRRTSLDRTSRRIRSVLNRFKWDTRLTQWLHGILIENLSQAYLAAYLDVLQTLKSKAPKLIDRMIVLSTTTIEDTERSSPMDCMNSPNPNAADNSTFGSDSADGSSSNATLVRSPADTLKDVLFKKTSILTADALNLLLKKPWDPFSPVVHINKLKKLACNPVFLYIPCGSHASGSSSVKRFKNICAMLSALGKVVALNIRHSMTKRLSVSRYASKMLTATKIRIEELRKSYPDRPLYLVGWGTGSIIATTASVSHVVAGVIALAFPLFGISGPRGTLEDPILDMKHPVLFVIGGRSADVHLSDMELLRKQLNCESSMVVIGCGNEDLQISRYHREKLLVTQSFVDKSIIDEISYFINLHSKHQQVTAAVVNEKSTGKSSGRKLSASRRNRTESASSNISIEDLKSSMVPLGRSESNVDDKLANPAEICLNEDLTNQTVETVISGSLPLLTPKTKRKPAVRPVSSLPLVIPEQKVGCGNLTSLLLQQSSGYNDPSSIFISQPPAIESTPIVETSPVLNYLNKSTGQQGDKGMLSLPGISSPAITTTTAPLGLDSTGLSPFVILPQETQGKEKKKKVAEGGEKKKRIYKPRPKKSLNTSSLSTSDQIGATVHSSILAGGATATLIQPPVNVSSSGDLMQQYVMQNQMIQHQQVIQQHLQQYRMQSAQSLQPLQPGQSQLLRLLSPSLPTTPVTTSGNGSYSIPITRPSIIETPKPTRFTGSELVDVGPPADVSVIPIGSAEPKSIETEPLKLGMTSSDLPTYRYPPPTALISREQLIKNMCVPLIRMPLPRIESSSSSIMGFQQQQAVPMPNFTADAKANVVFKAADKTIATNLRQVDLKALFDGGVVRFVVPGESGQSIPVNIILKHPMVSTTTTTYSGSNIIQSSPGLGSSVSPSVIQQAPPRYAGPVYNPSFSSPITPQTSLTRPDFSRFGQLVRTPVDSSGLSNPQVPVSVLMPKTFVSTAPVSTAPEGKNVVSNISEMKLRQEQELQSQKEALQSLDTTVETRFLPPILPPLPHQLTPLPPPPIYMDSTKASLTTTSSEIKTPMKEPVVSGSLEGKPDEPKSSQVTQSLRPPILPNPPSELITLPPPPIPMDSKTSLTSSSSEIKTLKRKRVSSGTSEDNPDEQKSPRLTRSLKLPILPPLPPDLIPDVTPSPPTSINIDTKTSLTATSSEIKTPKKRRVASGGSEINPDQLKSPRLTRSLRQPILPPLPPELTPLPTDSKTSVTATSLVIKTPKKKRVASGSSEDNPDEPKSPRLTRSMRRKSSTGGN